MTDEMKPVSTQDLRAVALYLTTGGARAGSFEFDTEDGRRVRLSAKEIGGPFDEALSAPSSPGDGWEPIETAPRGGGAEFVSDPEYVEPPKVLLLFSDLTQAVARWEWYYAEGGSGVSESYGVAWVEAATSELLRPLVGSPTHWRPLPAAPSPGGDHG